MFLFCNEDKKKKERLNSVLKTTHNLIKKNDIKDVRKNPVYSLIRAMSNYHLYDIVRELYEDEEVTDVQSIYKDIWHKAEVFPLPTGIDIQHHSGHQR